MSEAAVDLRPGASAAPGVDALTRFHPVVAAWFRDTLGEPTEPQVRGWPSIQEGRDVLIAAPTGSGKTLAAFLAALDRLFRQAIAGELPDQVQVVYVSPLKALGNDVQKNLCWPLEQITVRAKDAGLDPAAIRVQVRTGDTPASERAAMVKRPPHVLITTPESLYLYLTAAKSRETLKQVRTVIVDEIHAMARDKRGSHLAVSLERLKALCAVTPQLVGLSATQKPLQKIASFLTGMAPRPEPLQVIEVGHKRAWDLRIETPDMELSAAATHEMWGSIYDRMEALSREHRTVLIFSNTRRLAERVAHDLGERLGKDKVAAHHGSMARALRLEAEEKLKRGELRVMVATASLELGIDIGSVDLVIQIGTPRSISVFLQRVGRAGHHKGGTSKGVLFAMTRDELCECVALLRSVHDGELDAVIFPEKPLDVLAQQIVAACATEDWNERALYELIVRAYPYRDLAYDEYLKVVEMLAEGVSTARGRSRVHLHRDRVNGVLRSRRGARLTAIMNGGAIPDTFNYPVIAEPEGKQVGTLDEDFAVESMAGDVFLLGSTSWRIQSVRAGTVRVENAHGQAPTVPFWRGEAPARTSELSEAVGRLREDVLGESGGELLAKLQVPEAVATQLSAYLRASARMLGGLPSQKCVIAERFFDEAGGMQLIIHAPFGGRINRAWGMALRKRFCRTFDFELQAAANDDGILLSLGEQHSFPLEEIFDFVHPNTAEEVLVQAILQAPIFGTRFRWDATRALALSRYMGGKRVPPQLQRSRSDDLLAAVFPAQVACQDNHGAAEVEVPDHPIVTEAMKDCLREAMDVDGLIEVLKAMRDGRIQKRAVDLPEPSPLAHQMLNSAPYTYLDEAPLEERRARAVTLRRTLPPEDAAAFGALDAAAITQVIEDARPELRDAEELHDALLQLIVFPESMFAGEDAKAFIEELVAGHRAARLVLPSGTFLIAPERVQHVTALFPGVTPTPALQPLPGDRPVEREVAMVAVVRGWIEISGPLFASELAARLSLPVDEVTAALLALESQGQVLRGTFRPGVNRADGEIEWCDRRLLQRIHRLTVGRLRQEVEPLTAQDFMRFLFRWHHLEDPLRGRGGLVKAISLLQGYEAPAAAWEQFLLPSRMKQYQGELLERACWDGEIAWARLTLKDRPVAPGPKRGAIVEEVEPRRSRSAAPSRNANLTFTRRDALDWMLSAARPAAVLSDGGAALPPDLSHAGRAVAEVLERRGASFFQELVSLSRKLPAEVEDGLWELLAGGLVSADAIENLRVLQSPKKRRQQRALRRGGPGRWTLLVPGEPRPADEVNEKLARLFLDRYGIVFRDLVLREALAPSWRELLVVYRRMEARGEIRGGRFLAGFAGEQFALPEAVDVARNVRRTKPSGHRVVLCAVDPLNLTGVVTPGARIPSQLGKFVSYVDGIPQEEPGSLPVEVNRAAAQ